MTDKNSQKIIKQIIGEHYKDQTYKKEQLTDSIKTFVCYVKEKTSLELEHDHITNFAAQYLHRSTVTDEYFFNIKKKVKSTNFDDHSKLLSITEENFLDESGSEEFKVVDLTDDDDNNNDLDTEDFEELLFSNKPKANINKPKITEKSVYTFKYPDSATYKPNKENYLKNGPLGSQWVHDDQIDDVYNKVLTDRAVKFDNLRAVVLPIQRSQAWFSMREGAITASDGGCILGMNKYEPTYKFILKKCVGSDFKSNKFCYHGKKLEEPATMVYAYRMNVQVEEFGLMMHPKIPIFGASPDGICSRYKLDGKTKSKYVGRMLEIKCPYTRQILTEGDVKGTICPLYYWAQVQLQLECCDLDECDFWQCDIREYDDRDQFVADTHSEEPFRSKETGFEKGCLIQLIPKRRMNDVVNGKYFDVIYDDAIFIYPKKIEMSPYDCDMWVVDQLAIISSDPKYKDYVFDKVLYWKMIFTHNVTIERDREWFAESLPVFKKMWGYVDFFRKNKDKLSLFTRFINSSRIKRNNEIIDLAEQLCNTKRPNYDKQIRCLTDKIDQMEADNGVSNNNNNKNVNCIEYAKKMTITKSTNTYMFLDD